ncbi:CoA-binding protein [Chloroflexota bacterium]
MSQKPGNGFLSGDGLGGLDYLFRPGSIALIGITTDPGNPRQEWFLVPLFDAGFDGPIYLVNPRGGEIMGLPVYPDMRAIPGPVDYAIISTPADLCPQVLRDCGAKGVKVAIIYSAGFGETGSEGGNRLQDQLAEIAASGDIRLMGPNCMGVYCPEGKLSFISDFPTESGPVSFLCQSGGNTIEAVMQSAQRGVRFSKVVSYGDACDLNECDFLEYYLNDPDTGIIALYIEGVREGKRFLELLKKAAKVKPVIALKGGIGEAGSRTTASHTGSLSGSSAVWDALMRQYGIVQARSLEELSDLLVTFSLLPVPRSRTTVIVGMGGGASVLAADHCETAGLSLPPPAIRYGRSFEGVHAGCRKHVE